MQSRLRASAVLAGFVAFACLAGALLLPRTSAADPRENTVEGLTISAVIDELTDAGLQVSEETQDDGRTILVLMTEDDEMLALIVAWTEDGDANIINDLMFQALFEPERTVPLSEINDYNQFGRFIRVYLSDEGDVVIEYDLDLRAGVTEEAVAQAWFNFADGTLNVIQDLLD